MSIQGNIEKEYFEGRKRQIIDACPRCHGSNTSCSCYKEFYFEFKKKEAGIPLQFWGASLDFYTGKEHDSVKRRVSNYIKGFQKYLPKGRGLFFAGNSGSGKTSVAAYTLMELMKLGFSGKFKTLNDYIQVCRSSKVDYEKYLEIAQEVFSVDVLVLDNLGSEKIYFDDNIVNNHFEALLRARTSACKPTIFTSINTAGEWNASSYTAGIKSLIQGFSVTIHFPKVGDLREIETKLMEKELDAPIQKS